MVVVMFVICAVGEINQPIQITEIYIKETVRKVLVLAK
jgi:hypothetical protein